MSLYLEDFDLDLPVGLSYVEPTNRSPSNRGRQRYWRCCRRRGDGEFAAKHREGAAAQFGKHGAQVFLDQVQPGAGD